MTLPGLRTLPIRMRQHEENGQAVLSYLEKEPLVKTLYHPSLSFHRDLIALLKQAFDKVRENQ